MNALFKLPATRAWLALVAATLLLFALAEHTTSARVVTVAIMLIATFKVRLVFLYFMELESGVLPWRLVATAWMVIVTGIIVGLYLLTPS